MKYVHFILGFYDKSGNMVKESKRKCIPLYTDADIARYVGKDCITYTCKSQTGVQLRCCVMVKNEPCRDDGFGVYEWVYEDIMLHNYICEVKYKVCEKDNKGVYHVKISYCDMMCKRIIEDCYSRIFNTTFYDCFVEFHYTSGVDDKGVYYSNDLYLFDPNTEEMYNLALVKSRKPLKGKDINKIVRYILKTGKPLRSIMVGSKILSL